MSIVKTFEYKGYTVKIVYDECDNSPRDWDNLGTIATWHRCCTLGDIQPDISSTDFIKGLPEGTIILPVYMIDHSGLSINTHGFSMCDPSGWDSGQLGIIYCTPETYLKEGIAKKKVGGLLRVEIDTYDQFLRGEVYMYTVYKHCKECNHEIAVNSGYGFYDLDECGKESKSYVDFVTVEDIENKE